MKKLLLILLCVPMIGIGQTNSSKNSDYDKLIGHTYSNSEIEEKLEEWKGPYFWGLENSESLELFISYYYKDNQRLVIAKKIIGRNGPEPIWEIIGCHIIILEENQTFYTDIALDEKPDDRIIAVVILEDWECSEILKAWKLNIYSGEFEHIDVSSLSCYSVFN